MKFVTRTLLVILYTYLSISSTLTAAKASNIRSNSDQNSPCDNRKSGSTIILRNFPIKAELTWSGSIRDLDLTVRRKDGQSVNYQKKSNFDGKIHFLTNDARGSGTKKEAIAIEKINSGKYLIFVNNFSRDAHIGTSKGKIKFFVGNDQFLDVKVPNSDNNPSSLNWIVGLIEFSADQATFKLINKLSPFNQLDTFFEIPDEDDNSAKNYIEIRDFPIKLDLDWRAPNRDLDFYVRRSDLQQVNFSKKVNFGGKIRLIKDDKGPQRHETIIIERMPEGKFLVFVNNFSKDAHLSKSSAEVKISSNGRQITSVKIPSNDTNPSNLNWIVGMLFFDRDGAKFVTSNTLTTATGPQGFFNSIQIREGGSSPASPGYSIKDKSMKVELNWSPPNRDLDMYFRRSDGQQVNYTRKSNFDNKVQLIKDDRGAQKKETMIFQRLTSGKFILFINNFSKDAHISRSRANVTILVDNQVKETITIPSNDNNPRNLVWVVGLFDFDQGKFKLINKLTTDLNSVNNFFRSVSK